MVAAELLKSWWPGSAAPRSSTELRRPCLGRPDVAAVVGPAVLASPGVVLAMELPLGDAVLLAGEAGSGSSLTAVSWLLE